MIVYEGPSQLDQQPIVAILTGLDRPTKNPKTGPMAQLWILRADLSPLDAIESGDDYSICGDCCHRGIGIAEDQPELFKSGRKAKSQLSKRSCYVTVKNAPLQVWRAYQRGNYLPAGPMQANWQLRSKHLAVRLGAYGDPAAVPIGILEQLCKGINHTGYTHQWRRLSAGKDGTRYQRLVMASIDMPGDRWRAKELGWRTFRAKLANEENLTKEISCPSSAEAGHRTTCHACRLCEGSDKKVADVSIVVHGMGARVFVKLRRVAG